MTQRETTILSLREEVMANARFLAIGRRKFLYEDLVSVGWLGAIQAVDVFDKRRNVPLRLFAKHRIMGAMLDYLRTLDPLGRLHRKLVLAGVETAPIQVDLDDHIADCRTFRQQEQEIARLSVEKLFQKNLLSNRLRTIIELYYWDQVLLKNIGKRLGMCTSQTAQLLHRAERRLKGGMRIKGATTTS